MRTYRIDITRTDHGWAAQCKAFEATIDAAVLDDAIAAVRAECEDIAKRLLMEGRQLPADEPIIPDAPGHSIYFQTCVQEDYESANQSPVRRNVSMPAWLDKMLRRSNVDASRLFQDAAIAKLREMEQERRGIPKISNISDLEDACLPGVLDQYFRARLEKLLAAEGGKGE